MPRYYIEVDGAVSEALHSRLPTMLADDAPDGSVLVGELPDQSALLGALGTLDLLGFRIRAAGIVPVDTEEHRVADDLL